MARERAHLVSGVEGGARDRGAEQPGAPEDEDATWARRACTPDTEHAVRLLTASRAKWETHAVLRVERLDASAWRRLRAVRLAALRDSPDAFGGALSEEASRTEAEWAEWLTSWAWWVALDEGRDVGLVAGGNSDGRPWVFSMWVAPSHRGQGLAEALLDEVVAWARAGGATSLGLDVTDRAARARRCYLRYGFVPTGHAEPLPRAPTIIREELRLDLGPSAAR